MEITDFGPFVAFGITYIGKNEQGEIPQLWTEKLLPRMAPGGPCFGVCRCVPGMMDGTFEYIAAYRAPEGAPVPEGMVAVEIPKAQYTVTKVDHLPEIRQAWASAAGELNASAEWQSYCTGPSNCECANHPCFEYYPPEFEGDGPLYLYLPVKRKV